MLRRAIASRQYCKVHLRIHHWAREIFILRNTRCIPSSSYTTGAAFRRRFPYNVNYPATAPPPAKPALHLQPPDDIYTMLRDDTDMAAVLTSIRSSPTLAAFFIDEAAVLKLGERIAQQPSSVHINRYLQVVREMGLLRLKHNVYETLCHTLAGLRKWNLLLDIVQAGKQDMGRSSSRLLNWRVRALAELKEYRKLGGIIDEFKQQNCIPSRRTYHLLISAHIQNHNLAGARKCLLAMEEAGIPVEATTHAVITRYYRSFGADPHMIAKALESLHKLSAPEATSTLNSLIQIYMDKDDMTGIARFLSFFEPSSVRTISEVCFGSPVAASKEISLYPNATTFALFIARQATPPNLPAALQIFRAMTAQGVKPNPGVVSALVHVYCACEYAEEAAGLVYGICASTTPSLFYTPRSPEYEDIHVDIVEAKVKPTPQILHSLLKGILPRYGLDAVKWILHVMTVNNVEPNQTTLEIILRYLKAENMRPREILRVLRQLSSPTLQPTLRHMHVMFACFMRHEKYQLYNTGWTSLSSEQVKKNVRSDKFQEISENFDAFAGLLPPTYLHYRSLSKPINESLVNRDFRSDPAHIAMRIWRDAVVENDMDSAKEIFRFMLSRGIHPNEYHFSALMEGYTRAGDISSAIDTMKSAEQLGVKLNAVMFTILISAYARQGKPAEAMQMFERMVESGISPDVPSIDATCSAFYAAGQRPLARKLIKTLWSYIEPFPRELRYVPLKELARQLRSLHGIPTNEQKTNVERLVMRKKLAEIKMEWNAIAAWASDR